MQVYQIEPEIGVQSFLIFPRCQPVMVCDQIIPDMTVIEDNSDQYHLG